MKRSSIIYHPEPWNVVLVKASVSLIVIWFIVFCGNAFARIILNKKMTLMDTYSLDLDKDGSDELLLTTIDIQNKKKLNPVYVVKKKSDGNFYDVTPDFFEKNPLATHPRNVHFLHKCVDSRACLLITDHGADEAPFAGGISKFYLWNSKTKKFQNKTKEFNLSEKSFTFSSSLSSHFSDKRTRIIKANFETSGEKKSIVLYELNAKSKKFEQRELNIPQKKCFQNVLFMDVNNDGEDDIVLGGCDTKEEAFIAENLLYLKDKKGFVFWQKMAPRISFEAGWGTAAFYAKDMNLDGFSDLVEVVYNLGFTQAAINVYLNKQGTGFLPPQTYRVGKPGYHLFVPWVSIIDLNNDRYPEIVGTFRPSGEKRSPESYFILKSQKGAHFLRDESLISLPQNIPLVNSVLIKEGLTTKVNFIGYDGIIYP